MTGREALFYSVCLILIGAGWGITMPMTKISVSTGYGHFGLIFWQLVIGVALMGLICLVRGTTLRRDPGALWVYLVIALVGTVFPNTLSFQAAVHLPSGIMSLLLSAIPMFAFLIALPLGNDQFRFRRLVGLVLGLIGVLIIIAPRVDLGLEIPLFWASLYLLVALFYAFEGNYVARWGTAGLDPFQVMLGASLLGLVLITPLMIGQGQYIAPVWPPDRVQGAHILASVVHVLVYAGYVWLVGRTGATFAAQVSYLVTGFGLLWAFLILGEGYAMTLWLALGFMFAGMYFVQPRPRSLLPAERGVA
ncbi:MAG: DMT family transporter [Sulfitobacter sp.]|nr:DMT family transporter [Sulfitobacter sp.]